LGTLSDFTPRQPRKNQRNILGGKLPCLFSTSGAVITGVFGLFFTANQLGKRIDDLQVSLTRNIDTLRGQVTRDMHSLRSDLKDLRTEFNAFKEMVNGKFGALDLEIAKLMKRQNLH
jgi:hypothetical protein